MVNPTVRMRADRLQLNHPLPTDLATVRDALTSGQPAKAALAAMIAFHAPRNAQLGNLRLVDIRDGRMHLADITVILAEPVRQRLAVWLQERGRRWPNTINPHLFINQYTALRTCPVSMPWVSATLGMSAQAIREDASSTKPSPPAATSAASATCSASASAAPMRYAHTTDQPDPLLRPVQVTGRPPV